MSKSVHPDLKELTVSGENKSTMTLRKEKKDQQPSEDRKESLSLPGIVREGLPEEVML